MSSNPLVSIVMPAWNAEAYLQEAIDSVVAQSYPHWELLIVDDGSTDATQHIARAFRDSRVRYFRQQHAGVSAARNRALAESKGQYLSFLDADDTLPPRSLQARLDLFSASPALEFVDGAVVTKDAALDEVLAVKTHTFSGNPRRALVRLDERCFFGLSWMLKKVPGKQYRFDQRMTHSEDLMFYISISATGEYAATGEEVYCYRSRPDSAMGNLGGLADGYAQVYRAVRQLPDVRPADRRYLWRRMTRIMVLSYLANRQPFTACATAVRYLLL